LLRALGSRRDEVTGRLDLAALAASASRAEPAQLQSVAELLRALGSRRDEVTGRLDLAALAASASQAEPKAFSAVADLTGTLEAERTGFVSHLDAEMLANRILSASAINPHTLYRLVDILGSRRAQFIQTLNLQPEVTGKLLRSNDPSRFGDLAKIIRWLDDGVIQHLDFEELARTGSLCAEKDISGLTLFARSLRIGMRSFVRLMPWHELLSRCSVKPGNLATIADCVRNAADRSEAIGSDDEMEILQTWIQDNRAALCDAIVKTYVASGRYSATSDRSYENVSQLLMALKVACRPAAEYLVRNTASSFRRIITPQTLRTAHLCRLWEVMCDIAPDVTESLVRDEMVKRVLDP
jgi:hypothetical protein